jgi:leucyl aminopeptidase
MRKAEDILVEKGRGRATGITAVSKADWPQFLRKANQRIKTAAKSQSFEAAPLTIMLAPDANGAVAEVLVGAPAAEADPFALGTLASRLPPGHYAFATGGSSLRLAALGWCLELYKYDPYRGTSIRNVTLETPKGVDRREVCALANAHFAIRDLVNAPANLMGPEEIEKAAKAIAAKHKARFAVVRGEKLKRGFPIIHAVGAASTRPPRLIDFSWGPMRGPKITLVGKGVCFDTGGLDIKPSSNMLLMKKDMGGAANVLGLAQLIMEAKLPVRLRVLIPAVENSIAGDAFRPGDVFKTRKGLTVEIGNTDAEGRLILSDALALADEESPDLLIDMATLTGAARVALGPDLPPFFTDDDRLAEDLTSIGLAENDPVWRLPLWRPYHAMIETPIADINNAGAGGFAGAITAALFLRRFVERAKAYAHFDIFAWVPNAKPGRPKGGEAQAIRAIFALLQKRYGK